VLAGETDHAALRPDVWRNAYPEAIREYRIAERRDRADRKQYRRAAKRRATVDRTAGSARQPTVVVDAYA